MTQQKGICEECKVEYDYEYNPKFPRKYCPECSAKKKAEFEGRTAIPTPEMVKQVIEDNTKPEVVRPGEDKNWMTDAKISKERWTYNNCKLMCAKDIFCALIAEEKIEANIGNVNKLMTYCTDLVKQAQKELQ